MKTLKSLVPLTLTLILMGTSVYASSPTVGGASATSTKTARVNEALGSSDTQDLLEYVYPVGSIYMNINSTSPADLFGGEWEPIEDTFLLSAGQKHAGGTTGGEETHKLTVNEMPSHSHTYSDKYNQEKSGNFYSWGSGGNYFTYNDLSRTTNNTGGDQPHNNMPPYLTVYVWKRIA